MAKGFTQCRCPRLGEAAQAGRYIDIPERLRGHNWVLFAHRP